ncbi:fasciclin-like arabinogalactan protein 10 [Wolffia australiana]
MASSISFALLLLAAPLLAGAQPPAALPDPVAILTKGGEYKTLLSLLTQAKLVDPIRQFLNSSKDGLTIFAPTDSAFEELNKILPLSSIPQATVTAVLLLHVSPKFYNSTTLKATSSPVKTLAGNFTLTVHGGNDHLNISAGGDAAKVNKALYETSPLGLFSIDTVLLPSLPDAAPGPSSAGPTAAPGPKPAGPAAAPLPDPVVILTKAGDFKTLLDLLKKADLVGDIGEQLMNSKDGLTIFAPTDSAFEKVNKILPLSSIDPTMVRALLLLHVSPKFYNSTTLKATSSPVKTLLGNLTLMVQGGKDSLNISAGGEAAKVGKVLYETPPLGLFSIDTVLLPAAPAAPAAAPAPAPGSNSAAPVTAPGPKSAGPAMAPRPSQASFQARAGWGVLLIAALGVVGLL